MTVLYTPTKTSQNLQALSTYTASAVETIQFAVGLTGTGSTSRVMELTLRYPSNLSRNIACPLVLLLTGGGYIGMSRGSANIENFTTMGAVTCSFDYRTEFDSPFSHFQGFGDSTKSKAIRSAIEDVKKAVDFILQRKDAPNYAIDTRRVFAFGDSSGGQLWMMYMIENAGHQIAGLLNARAAFGLDGVSGGTTPDLRAFHDESEWVNASPPVVSFLGDSDTTVGVTYINSLKAKFDLDASNTTFLKVGGGHSPISTYGNVTSTFSPFDSVAPIEEARRFFNDIMSGLAARLTTKVTFT